MAIILCIETSGKNCSVAISKDGAPIGVKEFSSENYTHAEALHPFIEDVCKQASVVLGELEAIAVSKGPGSYTGLRIGVSSAKGLCFALGIPLIAVDTLQALALKTSQQHPGFSVYQPMLDARRMEVYTARFSSSGEKISDTEAIILDQDYFETISERTAFSGNGADKCIELIHAPHQLFEGIDTDASMLTALAELSFGQSEFADLAYFEPFYLKDFIPGIAKKSAF
jgi:tRNA threonylcarbamoyladenosine biosynthesis protein TsaB